MPNGPQPRGIRFPTGGSHLWFLDFYDTSIRAPLNAPAGYKVTVMFSTPSESRSWPFQSVESLALGKEGIEPGSERFSGTESVRCSLVRPGLSMPLFLFTVPDRIAPYDEPEFARATTVFKIITLFTAKKFNISQCIITIQSDTTFITKKMQSYVKRGKGRNRQRANASRKRGIEPRMLAASFYFQAYRERLGTIHNVRLEATSAKPCQQGANVKRGRKKNLWGYKPFRRGGSSPERALHFLRSLGEQKARVYRTQRPMEGYMQQSQMAANVERIEKRKAEEPFRREESNPGHTRR
ncbi:hypothetical protein B0H14DRAFT_3140372 [Mycena olivaceomarginata]|nr:hypothetical protein B0H14DRAFT_3140372 [Mycena olivaceomarginata]